MQKTSYGGHCFTSVSAATKRNPSFLCSLLASHQVLHEAFMDVQCYEEKLVAGGADDKTSISPSFCALRTASSVLLADRLNTEIAKPFSAMFSAKFCKKKEGKVKALRVSAIQVDKLWRTCPMTARPQRPISDTATALRFSQHELRSKHRSKHRSPWDRVHPHPAGGAVAAAIITAVARFWRVVHCAARPPAPRNRVNFQEIK